MAKGAPHSLGRPHIFVLGVVALPFHEAYSLRIGGLQERRGVG